MKKKRILLMSLICIALSFAVMGYEELVHHNKVLQCQTFPHPPFLQEQVKGLALQGADGAEALEDEAEIRLTLPENRMVQAVRVHFSGPAPDKIVIVYQKPALMSRIVLEKAFVKDGLAEWEHPPAQLGMLSIRYAAAGPGKQGLLPAVEINPAEEAPGTNLFQFAAAALLGAAVLFAFFLLSLCFRRRHPLLLLILAAGLLRLFTRVVYTCGMQAAAWGFLVLSVLLLAFAFAVTGGYYEQKD